MLFSWMYGDLIPAFLGSPVDIDLSGGFMDALVYNPADSLLFRFLKIWEVIDYIFIILGTLAACVMLYLMRKQSKLIVSDITAFEETVRVKKSSFLWLGFLLGGYGAHLFYIKKKKRGYIFLGAGLAGLFNPITFFYTSAISFADTFLVCFYPKDWDGMVEFEYYPYWL